MATKDSCFFENDIVRGSNGQYSNLNLNENFSKIVPVHSNNGVTADRKSTSKYDFTGINDSQAKKESTFWKNECKLLTTDSNFNDSHDYGRVKNQCDTNTTDSTLSLHIIAYENSIEASCDSFGGEKVPEDGKENLLGSNLIIQNYCPFEFPRQQNNEVNKPEVAQFKASQKLLDSSKSPLQTVAQGSQSNWSQVSETPQTEENNNNLTESNDIHVSQRTPISANVRFLVALGVLISLGLAMCLCQGLLSPHATVFNFFAALCTIFVTFFSVEWIRIHSFALTRQKRAFFDETNILETYQPRSRTHGHLFQPDPPTPGPVVKFSDDKNAQEHSANEKAAFNAMRDAHYENMFEHAARVAKEAEESDRQALEAQKARLSQNNGTSDPTLPKGEPLYEDLPANPPVNGPSQLDNGTKLELPASLIDKSEDSSARDGKGKLSPKQKSSKTKGLFFEDHVKGATSTSTAATSTSTLSTASTPATDATTLSTATSGGSKSGQKRRKNKKL